MLDLFSGRGQSRAPKARAARGVRGHVPPEDFDPLLYLFYHSYPLLMFDLLFLCFT